MGRHRLDKLRRRQNERVQEIFHENGTFGRVRAAYKALHWPLFQAELRARVGAAAQADLDTIAGIAADLLRERNVDLEGVKVEAFINPQTRALVLRADADEMATRRAQAAAARMATA